MQSRPHLRRPVSVTRKRKEHHGCYYTDGSSITVHYGREGSSPTPIGELDAHECACDLLLQLVRKQESEA